MWCQLREAWRQTWAHTGAACDCHRGLAAESRCDTGSQDRAAQVVTGGQPGPTTHKPPSLLFCTPDFFFQKPPFLCQSAPTFYLPEQMQLRGK